MKQFFICILLVNVIQVYSQETFNASKNKQSFEAFHTTENIFLDGKLNEACWRNATPAGNFVQIEPRQGEPSAFKTEVKAVYNSRALYISFTCYDSAGTKNLRAPNLKRDFNYLQNDMVAIGIDGFNDGRNSATFAANAYGAQKDYLSFDDSYFDSDWNGLWSVRTTRTDSCWIAEFELPWKSLRYKKTADASQALGINLLRLQRNSNEVSVWSPYPRSCGFNRMEYAGKLTALVLPNPSSNIQINPYSLVASNSQKGNPAGKGKSVLFKTGGEIKWAVTPNLLADATINTDFAQADADLQVNNLSRFSIFFPEKRQFFLENASLFSPGLNSDDGDIAGNMIIQPFFSRRIGLDADGNPIPITNGERFVYRSSKRNFGGMYLRQEARDSSPAINFAIGRYSQNMGKSNRIGALVVSKFQQANTDKTRYTNFVGGVDGFFRITKAHSVNFMMLQSTNNNTRQKGYSGFAQYFYNTNYIKAWVTESFVTDKFNAETGFLSRTNTINTAPGFSFNIRGKWLPGFIREYSPAVYSEWYHEFSTGLLQERTIKINPVQFTFSNGGGGGFMISNNRQNLAGDFSPLGILIEKGRYDYSRQTMFFKTDDSRKIAAAVQYDWGNYYNGKLNAIDASITYSPLPYITATLSANSNQLKQVGKNLVDKNVNLYTINGRFALNPRVQLTALYQKNTLNKQDNYNFRLSWEYKPLSYVYIVFNNRSFMSTTRQTEETTIFKISYLKQF